MGKNVWSGRRYMLLSRRLQLLAATAVALITTANLSTLGAATPSRDAMSPVCTRVLETT